jgi:hypothetical protein
MFYTKIMSTCDTAHEDGISLGQIHCHLWRSHNNTLTHRIQSFNSSHSCFLFGKSRHEASARRSALLSKILGCFPHYLEIHTSGYLK